MKLSVFCVGAFCCTLGGAAFGAGSLKDLTGILDDRQGVQDACTYLLLDAPVGDAAARNAPGVQRPQHSYGVIYKTASPASVGKLNYGEPATYSRMTQLAMLLFFQSLAGQSGFNGFFNGDGINARIKEALNDGELPGISENVYLALLNGTSASRDSGDVTFATYTASRGTWGKPFADLLLSDGYFTIVIGKPPREATHELLVQLYKLRVLNPQLASSVRSAWQAGQYAGTQFAVAAVSPWPFNCFIDTNLTDIAVNPLVPYVQAAARQQTVHVQKDTECTFPTNSQGKSYCHDTITYPAVGGEPIWRYLQTLFGGSSYWQRQNILASGKYPKTLDLPLKGK